MHLLNYYITPHNTIQTHHTDLWWFHVEHTFLLTHLATALYVVGGMVRWAVVRLVGWLVGSVGRLVV